MFSSLPHRNSLFKSSRNSLGSDRSTSPSDAVSSDESDCSTGSVSSYYLRPSYNYSTLAATEVLVTTDDVGRFHAKSSQKGQGIWVHYVLAKERRRILMYADPAKLRAEGRRYHMKSITEDLARSGNAKKLITYCASRGVRAIVPASVPDSIFVSTHKKELASHGIQSLTCDDPRMHVTLDHKWLCYELLRGHGVAQPRTLPVRADTARACREMVEENAARGTPCFVKRTFDTLAGDGVAKVRNFEEYRAAVAKLSGGAGAQPPGTPGEEQVLILQVGHPGDVFEGQAIFFEGELVACYITRENPDMIHDLGNHRTDMMLGRWAPSAKENTLRLQLRVEDERTRNAIVSALHRIGAATGYTGVVGAEFLINRDPVTGVMIDEQATLLEVNARFSGGIHSTLGSGFIQDYTGLLAAVVAGTPSRDLPLRNQWPLVRSDGHEPQSDFLAHNPLGWSVRNLGQLATVRHMYA